MTVKERRAVQVYMRASTVKALSPYVKELGEHVDDVVDRLIKHMEECRYRPRRPRPPKQVQALSVPQDNGTEEKEKP